jgi:uncharacterized glyoxalase superfamily protein PhnB/predicted kinase
MTTNAELVPLLVVRGAARAIDFYVQALGAQLLARYEHGPERRISHADLALGAATFSVTEEARAWNSDSPESLAGSPVVLQLAVRDAAATLRTLEDAGATVIFPLQELFGERMARIRDPFGHLWIVKQRLTDLSGDQIQRLRDELPKDPTTLRDARLAPQAQNACIHLVLGPVGAGKSTYALELAREHRAVRLTLDEWMAVLFRADRPVTDIVPWYLERAARSVEQIWSLAQALHAAGTSAVLEIGLLQRAARLDFYRRVEAAGLPLSVHILEAPRDVRRARVEQRNRSGGPTFSMLVPPEVFELASDLWEPVDPSEGLGRELRVVDSER